MKTRSPLLTSTAYFAPAHWFAGAVQQGHWLTEGHENYQKGGFRNRCRIIGPNGPQLLTVPLQKGKHQQSPIQQVAISYHTDWPRQHEQTIRTAYGRAPFFEYFAEYIFEVLRSQPATLWELNQNLQAVICRLTGAGFTTTITEDFIRPDNTDYLRPAQLPDSLQDYPQVFTDRFGFTPGLSVLDALFCLGPQLMVTKLKS